MNKLNQELLEFQCRFENGQSPYNVTLEQIALMQEFERDLYDSGVLKSVLRPGDKFPYFELLNYNRLPVSLDDLLLRGPVVICFFRGVWCPYCNIELAALQQAFVDIEAAGATLIAISSQLPQMNRKIVVDKRLMFDILSDQGNQLSEKVGIAYRLNPKLIHQVYKKMGVDLAVFNGDKSWRLPVTSRFIINDDGIVISSEACIDYRKRIEPAETIAIVRALTRRTVL